MKRYVKEINKRKVIKTREQIVITKDGKKTYNPTEAMILADGWTEYVTPTYERTIEDSKKRRIKDVEMYDKSKNVNIFYINDTPMWIDKATRVGLSLRFKAESDNGKTDTSLWHNGVEYPMTLESAVAMLYAIEMYASECYDTTQKHIAAIKALETIEEVEGYDYRNGYPSALRF